MQVNKFAGSCCQFGGAPRKPQFGDKVTDLVSPTKFSGKENGDVAPATFGDKITEPIFGSQAYQNVPARITPSFAGQRLSLLA